jgi:hypothetical protein
MLEALPQRWHVVCLAQEHQRNDELEARAESLIRDAPVLV